MRKFLIGAFLVLASGAIVTGSNSSQQHREQPKATAPTYNASHYDEQVPTFAMDDADLFQVIRSDNGWCYVKDAATAIDAPVMPVQEVANSPPGTIAVRT